MLTKVKELATDVLSALTDGTRIPIQRDRAAARPSCLRGACPKLDVVPRVAEVVITFDVPGATASNTQLAWNEDLRTLSLEVGGDRQDERYRAVIGCTSDVDGASGSARLNGDTLTVRLPRRDLDTLTGLPAWLAPAVLPSPLALCS